MMNEEDYKFLIGGLLEYISESTDYWDYHDDISDFFLLAVDWSDKLKSGLEAAPLPSNSACTCPNDWAKERMKTVEAFLQEWMKNGSN